MGAAAAIPTTDQRRSTRPRALQLLALTCAVAALAWSFRDTDPAAAARAIASVGPVALLALLPYGCSVLLDAAGFRRLFAAIGRRVDPLRLACIRLGAESLASSLPGGAVLAETLKPALLRSRCGIPLAEGASAIAARKCLIVSAHGLYLLLATLAGWGFLADRSQQLTGGPWLAWLAPAVALALLLAGMSLGRTIGSGSLVSRCKGLLARVPLAPLRRWLATKRDGLDAADAHLCRALDAPTALRTAPWYLAMWLAESCETWLLLQLLGMPVGFAEALALEASISIVRALAFFVPAGLGFQDAGYVLLLRGAAAPEAASLAAAFALLKRARELVWIGIGLALLALWTRVAERRAAAHPAG